MRFTMTWWTGWPRSPGGRDRRSGRSVGHHGTVDQQRAPRPRRGFVKRAEADGATVVVGGARPKDLSKGFYFEPTILTDAPADSHIAQEEVFGPVLTVLRYRDDDDAVAIANNSAYGLGGAVWGRDVDRAVAIARRIRTGQVSINGTIPGDAPFGGFKQSGIGREGGVMGLRAYMEPKAIGIPA